MRKVLVGIVGVVLFTGCSGSKETKTVCKSNVTSDTEITKEIEATGDKVTKAKETVKKDFTDTKVYQGITEATIEELAKALESGYQAFKGTSFSYTIKDMRLEYRISFDYQKMDLDALQNAKEVVVEKDGEKYASLKANIESLEKEEMTCR